LNIVLVPLFGAIVQKRLTRSSTNVKTEELRHVPALFPALYTLALPCSQHAETHILHVTERILIM